MELAVSHTETSFCCHCGTSFQGPGRFCCSGCEAVYGILQARGLSHYYELRKDSPKVGISRPVNSTKQDFRFLRDHQGLTMNFWLEGVHCLSCLWLLEKLPEILPGVEVSRLNLGSSVLEVRVAHGTSFETVAKALEELGYPPHPIAHDASDLQRKENRGLLLRLGIAGACAGNIMLLAISQYGGASGSWGQAFGWIAAAISLPVLLYSATPFYVTTWNSLKRRQISIDLPIVAAIWAAAAVSFWHLVIGRQDVYFDSLSTLVFLLLSSRYILRRIQQTQLSSSHLLEFLSGNNVRCRQDGHWVEKYLKDISIGDRLLVAAGERFPTDGILRMGNTHSDLSLLTGEAIPVPIHLGDSVYAGTTNLDEEVEVEVTATGGASRLGAIVKQISLESGWRAPVVEFADRVARWFVGAVLGAAAVVFFTFLGSDTAEGTRRALSLIIVTCPCVLAFALPLSMAISMRQLAAKGILLKDAQILERIAEVKHLFLDKTGTLTEGKFEVLRWIVDSAEEKEIRAAVLALELRSRHPVAKALVRYLSQTTPVPSVTNFREELRSGVEGVVLGKHWKVGRLDGSGSENLVGVWRDGELRARVTLGDSIRSEAAAALGTIRLRGVESHLLSGDRQEPVDFVAQKLGIGDAKGSLTPENKASIVRSHRLTAMVGDGANDSVAFAAADVGIAMHGSVEMALKSAHVFLSRPGLSGVLDLFRAADRNGKVIRRNLFFSATYNVLGGTLALLGWMTPLWAAVLMPLSALTVFSATLWQLRRQL